jgi:phage gpG-like protein
MRVDHIKESEWPQYLADIHNLDESADYTAEIDGWHGLLEALALASFDAQQSPEGHPWPAWEWRNPKYHGEDRALVNTGRLADSFLRGGSGNVDAVGPKNGEYGTNVDYAGVHQSGGVASVMDLLTQRGTGRRFTQSDIHVPKRPMLGASDRVQERFAETVANALVEHMKG